MRKQFMTLAEAARHLNVEEETVRRLAVTGVLPEFRDRDRLMFKTEHIEVLAQNVRDGLKKLEACAAEIDVLGNRDRDIEDRAVGTYLTLTSMGVGCKLIDTGHSDRVLIVSCPEVDAELAALRKQVEALKASREMWRRAAYNDYVKNGTMDQPRLADAACRAAGVEVED